MYFDAIQRRQNHHKADICEAINQGFGGGKELTEYIKKLRED